MSEQSDLPPALQRFDEELARVAATLSSRERRQPVARRRTIFGGAILATGAVAVALAIVITTQGGGTTGIAHADPLTLAAQAALAQPSLFPRDDQYFYVRTEGTQPTGMSTNRPQYSIEAVETVITDRWQSAARTSVQRTRIVALRFRSPSDANYWRAHGGPHLQVGATETTRIPPGGYYIDIGRGQLARRQVLSLPTTAQAMYDRLAPSPRRVAQIVRHASPSLRQQIATLTREFGSLSNYLAWTRFNAIASTFQQSPLPPAVRSAMYGALALIPGVTSIGTDRDLAGRRGAAVVFDDHHDGTRTELIFDPTTSALLGERETVIRTGTGYRVGAIVENLAFLNEAVTNTTTIPHTNRLH
jgi:hypothetical protein